VITGSSATLLSKELGTKLTGRHVDIIVWPFSFLEFIELKEVVLDKETVYKTETKVEMEKYFEEYLIMGGMPEYLIYKDQEILTRIYEDTILKDIAVRYRVKNVAILRQLYSYLINNFANRFSYNSLKKFIPINSVNTFKKFISYLEETYFAKTITKFDYSFKKQILSDKKFYVLDNGFIEILSKKITKDKGWLLENLVFNCLNKDYDIFYHSAERECDFVIVKNKSVIQAIQVCFELNQENRSREIDGLIEAMKKFRLKEGLLLTNGQDEEIKLGERKIIVKPVWRWMIQERGC
ncbi:ATP-binding protein, partial [Candidatus Woesearchaeota archaeon]|nr:ATP-binding protein [Candidatus Woesearchaeota archaeon]